MLKTQLRNSTVKIGKYFGFSLQRTLRIPDDGRTYPLPPSLGNFPLFHVEEYKSGVPAQWLTEGGLFMPMYQREAMWIGFHTYEDIPTAVKIGIGKINALTGTLWSEPLQRSPQDYLTCPDQPWLDGINAGEGLIRQFVAVPLGQGLTVEGQLTGKEEVGGLQVLAYQPRQDIINKILTRRRMPVSESPMMCCQNLSMGLGAGGTMKQKIYADDKPATYWDQTEYGRVFIHIVNSEDFKQITGMNPPPTPVSAKAYINAGLPWFDLYDAEKAAIGETPELQKVKSISEIIGEMPELPVIMIPSSKKDVADGTW